MSNLIDRAFVVHKALEPDTDTSQKPTLVVGDVVRWRQLGYDLPDIEGFVFVDFDDVTLYTLEIVRPQVILSPLLGRSFDAVEIARRLTAMGFKGKYRIVTDGLPDQDVVLKDVEAVAPTLDFGVINLPNLKARD